MSKAHAFSLLGRLFSRRATNRRGAEFAPGPVPQIRRPSCADDWASPEDFPEVIAQVREAAEQGDAAAQNGFGLRFASGQGVPRSDTEASRWFRRAAEQGLAEAQFNLGRLVYTASVRSLAGGNGEGWIEAYMWFHLAAAQGHRPAEAFEETLNLQLIDADLQEGNRRADAFQPRRELPVNLAKAKT